jgi:beta-lactamase regulating signal transducer with metallopeptidase domain
MTREQRQYTIARRTVLGVSGVLLVAHGVLVWRFWPYLQRFIHPTTLSCGCTTVTVQASWWSLAVASIVMLLTAYTAVRLVFRGIRLWRMHRQLNRDLGIRTGRELQHQTLKMVYTLIQHQDPIALTLGYRRPRVIVSEALVHRIQKSEVEAVLRHEREHQRAHDPLFSWWLDVAATGWHWLPGVRGIATAIYSLRELSADAAATSGYRSTTALSGAFLNLQPIVQPEAIAAFSANADRLARLMDEHWQPKRTWWQKRTIVAIAIVFGLSLTLGRVMAAEQTDPPVAKSMCHQAVVMCQDATLHLQSMPNVCSGLSCVSIQRYATPINGTSD